MAESKAAWDKVGEDFKVLGRQVKQHYDERPRPGTEIQEAQEGQAAPAADRRKVDEALEKLRDSLEQAFSALGDAVRDPDPTPRYTSGRGSPRSLKNASLISAS